MCFVTGAFVVRFYLIMTKCNRNNTLHFPLKLNIVLSGKDLKKKVGLGSMVLIEYFAFMYFLTQNFGPNFERYIVLVLQISEGFCTLNPLKKALLSMYNTIPFMRMNDN